MGSGTSEATAGRLAGRRDALVARTSTVAGARVANAAAAVLLGLGALVAWGGLWLEDRADPPQCYGIGWGCSADPGTSMFFIGWFVLAPAFLVLTLGIWVGRRLAGSPAGWRLVGAALVVLPVVLSAVAFVGLLVASLVGLPGWVRAVNAMEG